MIKSKERNNLIEKIKNIQDPKVIEEIYRLLDINLEESKYQLSKQQRREIDKARKEIAKGEGIPSEEVDKEIDEWLKE